MIAMIKIRKGRLFRELVPIDNVSYDEKSNFVMSIDFRLVITKE